MSQPNSCRVCGRGVSASETALVRAESKALFAKVEPETLCAGCFAAAFERLCRAVFEADGAAEAGRRATHGNSH